MRPDLKKHFIAGAAIGAAVAVACGYAYPSLVSFTSGAAVAWVVGRLKEKLWDRYMKRGTYDPADAGWTGVGGLVGATAGTILTYLI